MELLLHSHILLASNSEVLNTLKENPSDEVKYTKFLLNGQSYKVVEDILSHINQKIETKDTTQETLISNIREFLTKHFKNNQNLSLYFAIALLQTFIQDNYTGPSVETDIIALIFNIGSDEIKSSVQKSLKQSLSVLGQPVYELLSNPECITLSLLLFEQLTEQPSLFDSGNLDMQIPEFQSNLPGLMALANWWRARALLVQLSLLPEATGIQSTIAASILDSIDIAHSITNDLPSEVDDDLKKKIYTIYYLENVKTSLAINTEHLCLPSLTKVKKLTNFQFVLTGARAKRTKFQETGHAGLVILAESSTKDEDSSATSNAPESFTLESDMLLEKPIFDSIGSEPLDEQVIKRQKVDPALEENNGLDEDRLLPLAIRQEYIPKELQALDANAQPTLNSFDIVQLLLRLYTIRQTSPARDPLVEEELSALVTRIIYQSGNKNWSIFSRALWERSVLESNRAKTVERGILQMQSLVEELGLQIQTRLIPQDENKASLSSAPRLKFIHQLPFIPRWELDAKLAEKYMSLGVLRSAVEIYDRLHMWCESALCYAAVGDEKQAKEILTKRVEDNPADARALSILGDITQDPNLWKKSWEVGKYVNAKNSLARYYYNPPQGSGVVRDYGLVLSNLNESLRQYPLSFDTWYFYGCAALECEKFNVAAEAFSRCVSLDETHSMSWSNLSAAYVQLEKSKEAFSCLKKAVSSDSQKNWRIWENYLLVAVKLNEWNDVLIACKQLVNIKRDKVGEGSVDLPVVEKLVALLVSTDYSEGKLNFFQKSCIEFICVTLPTLINTNSRLWKLVAKVELWRKRPWASLDCHEKAFRAISHNPNVDTDETIWNETVEACEDLVSSYESLGEREGKYGSGSLVCKDWKYKARSTIKGLMSKGKGRWDGTDGWERLMAARSEV